MINTNQYNKMWTLFQNGRITTGEWTQFCQNCFNVVISQPEVVQVMVRLKNR
jgi:hypothetical protein